ncbi:glyoxalase [Paractinoplanes abujensis]|uniref:Catechol-2,3-dioxygenase n=1 Tax=Paractinoplanes abujensis TaxID=882441 RepID=A0A7W7G5D8_9ACTN|nr:VOC family protein [Actinoplanes abujensis]MBB4694826.1 catechol-2,3-dioxygenase [Actinoplanes abujensis]GID23557.1 glyoxalase [Actinoplanes abujensis]
MDERPQITLTATVLDASDARALAAFYQRLLGWSATQEEDHWVVLGAPGGGAGLSFQTEKLYRRPVWPARAGEPQMSMHLDIRVEDLEAACAHATRAGATLADFQPQENVRVFLDPDGHPFCLYVD